MFHPIPYKSRGRLPNGTVTERNYVYNCRISSWTEGAPAAISRSAWCVGHNRISIKMSPGLLIRKDPLCSLLRPDSSLKYPRRRSFSLRKRAAQCIPCLVKGRNNTSSKKAAGVSGSGDSWFDSNREEPGTSWCLFRGFRDSAPVRNALPEQKSVASDDDGQRNKDLGKLLTSSLSLCSPVWD